MNGGHRKTLEAVFAEPVTGSVEWRAIEALLVTAGCRIVDGSGSRLRIEHSGIVAFFHQPHPQKGAKRYQVRDAREFLSKIGVIP